MSDQKPLVSVCMITYNHEKYIAEAIEGVLNQETDFPIELIIGEDFSTDQTRAICEEYASRYPNIVRLLPRAQNLGIKQNFLETLQNCSGKYIALCEGDDYWSYDQKLREQIRFLENNLEYAGTTHNVTRLDEGDGATSLVRLTDKNFIEAEDVFDGVPMTTAAHVFRNILPLNILAMLPGLYDWVVLIFICSNGRMHVFDEAWSVYRVHRGGWSSSMSREKADNVVDTALAMREHFAPTYFDRFSRIAASWSADACFLAYSAGDIADFKRRYADGRDLWSYAGSKQYWALQRKRIVAMSRSLLRSE